MQYDHLAVQIGQLGRFALWGEENQIWKAFAPVCAHGAMFGYCCRDVGAPQRRPAWCIEDYFAVDGVGHATLLRMGLAGRYGLVQGHIRARCPLAPSPTTTGGDGEGPVCFARQKLAIARLSTSAEVGHGSGVSKISRASLKNPATSQHNHAGQGCGESKKRTHSVRQGWHMP